MKRILLASVAALLGLSAVASAGPLCGCGVHCVEPGRTCCLDCCSCPCDGLRLYGLLGPERTQKFLDMLCTGDPCDRIRAARALGGRLNADYCSCPEVLSALVKALQCDCVWEVRRAAARAILGQNARTEYGILALYIASKLDTHYLVRVAAAESLDILIIGRRGCYCELLKQADDLVKKLRPLYKPSTGQCVNLMEEFCAAHGISPMMAGPHGVAMQSGTVVGTPTAVVVNEGKVISAPVQMVPMTTVIAPGAHEVMALPTSSQR